MSSVPDDANHNPDPLNKEVQPQPESQAAPAADPSAETPSAAGGTETPGEGNTENQAAQPAPIIEHRLDKELNFVDLLQIVKRHILLIVLIMTAVSIGVGYRYMTAQRLYRANAIIHISQKDSGIDGGAGLRKSAREEDFLNTLIALLQSDDVIVSTYNNIAEDPEKKKGVIFSEFVRGSDAWKQYVVANLRIKLGGEGETKKANVLSVSYSSPSPREAYVVISTLLDQFQIYFEKQYTKATSAVQRSLQEGIRNVNAGIAETNRHLNDYLVGSSVAMIGVQESNPVLTRIQELEESIVDLDYQKIRLQNRLDMIESRINGRDIADIPEEELIIILGAGNETVTGIGQEQSIATITALARGGDMTDTLESTLLTLDLEQSALMLKEMAALREQNVGEDNPRMIALRKGYEDLIEYRKMQTGLDEGETLNRIGIFTYQEYMETYIKVLHERIDALTAQRERFQEYIDAQAGEIQDINDHFLALETLQFSISSQKELSMQLVRKLDQVNILSKYGGYKIEVVMPPREPTIPYAPNRLKYGILALFLGGLLGFATAFTLDMLDTTFRNPDSVSTTLGIRLLAQLPSFQLNRKYKKNLENISIEPGIPIASLFAYHFPDSPQCETFRALRSKVFFNNRSKPRVVLFTSPHSGDGKTTFVSSMAIMLAEADKKVLLIDGDIRKPDVHKKFNLKNQEGFAELLAGTHTEEELARPTKLKNLSVITAGLQRKNPSEKFIAANLVQLFERLKTKYDYVLVDSSPVLYVSDVCNVAAKVDGVIYVFRIRRNGQPDVTQGVRIMGDVGANFIGCVVNCHQKHRFYDPTATSKKKASYGYGYGYGYGGYGYGRGGYGYGRAGAYGPAYGTPYGSPYGSAYTGYGYGTYGKKYGNYGDDGDDASEGGGASGGGSPEQES